MISAQYYYLVYLIFVTIATLIVGNAYNSKLEVSSKQENHLFSVLTLVCITLYIGLRPISAYFDDMVGYVDVWEVWDENVFEFSLERENFLFDNLRAFMSTAGIPVEAFFMLIAIIYFVSTYIACRKLFPNDTLFAFLVFLAAFSTFSYGTNGIKAGSAASLFLVALAYRDNLKVSIPMAIIACGFHHSMIMVLCSYLIVLIVKNRKIFFYAWVFSFIIAALHITFFQQIFAGMADEGGQAYLDDLYGSGFRIDFILYSFAPVVMGYYVIFVKGINSKMYSTILNLYLLTNSIWMLCMYASFTNRIAYLSWFLYPFVLIYPLFEEDWGEGKYRTARLVAYGHLAFTLFMYFVYYR